MNLHSKSKIVLALVLAITIAATGCSAQWISLALQDLPVLTQMALNVAALVSTLVSGPQASAADVAVIQNVSAQASRDLSLLQSLYSEYKANPNATTLQKIQNVISDLNQNMPALLQSAHIGNPVLSARITAAVNLILTTVNSFCCINSPDRAFGFSFNFAASPHASASWRESLKEAVEPANLRANRKYRARWGPDSSPRMVEGTDLRLSEIDDLPSGSRVLNATGVQENNFPLAGRQHESRDRWFRSARRSDPGISACNSSGLRRGSYSRQQISSRFSGKRWRESGRRHNCACRRRSSSLTDLASGETSCGEEECCALMWRWVAYFLLHLTPSFVCSIKMPAAVSSARMASDTTKFLDLRAVSISATF